MVKVQITYLTCKRCGHRWPPKREMVYICPKCKNPKWNEPVKEGKK